MRRSSLAATAFLLPLFLFLALPGLRPTAQAQDRRLLGDWQNVDQETRGITKVRLQANGNRIQVRVWGKCHPIDCDWGVVDGFAEGESISSSPNEAHVVTATFENSWSVKTLFIRMLDNNWMQVEIHTRFTDNSGRSAYTQTYGLSRG